MGSELKHASDMEEGEACELALKLSRSTVFPLALKAAVELDLLEIMAKAGEGTLLTPGELAAHLPSKNPDAPAMLERILRLLANQSVLTSISYTDAEGRSQRRYGLTSVGRFLVRDEDGVSLAPLLLVNMDKVSMECWFNLKDAVLEGSSVFYKALGMSLFEYQATDPRFNQVFNKAMSDHSTLTMKKLLTTYTGFEGLHSLVDVGGGFGAVLNQIKSKYPHIKALNFDLPHVIKQAPKFPGVEYIEGDMFLGVPTADAIFMKWILNDWSDEKCVKLLQNCFKALPVDGKLIVMDAILPETVDLSYLSAGSFESDIQMLTYSPDGKERTEKEMEALALAAGFAGIKPICRVFFTWVIEFYKKM